MGDKSEKNFPDAQDILEFVFHLKERGNSPESVNCYQRAIKVFFRWAQNQGFFEKNPAQGIPFQKVKRALFPTLWEGKARRMVLALHDLGIVTGYEDGAFRPDKPLTRMEAVSLIFRALTNLGRLPPL